MSNNIFNIEFIRVYFNSKNYNTNSLELHFVTTYNIIK